MAPRTDGPPPDPDPERWDRLEAEFHHLASCPPSERAAALADFARTDPAFHDDLSALLAGDEAAHLAGDPAGTPDDLAAAPGLGGLVASALGSDTPRSVGPFRIIRRLGEGGMGVVYEAEQPSPKRRVALKVIRPDLASSEVVRRFALEAKVLARLDHPGIATIYAVGGGDPSSGEPPWISMELVDGKPLLDDAMARGLGVAERVERIAAIADALAHAHARGVVHRDVKPANVLVDVAGRPRMLDFGVARLVDASTRMTSLHTRYGRIVGTLAYMSPEQASGNPDAVDARSDVYSLGVVAYELLGGRRPVDVDRLPLPVAIERLLTTDAPTLGTLRADLRGDLSVVVGKAMEKEPARRYPGAGAFADDLRRILRHEPVAARAPTAGYRVRKFVQRHPGLVAGVVAAFLALGTGLLLALKARAEEATERARADRVAAASLRSAYRAELAGAVAALRGGDPRTARRRLALAPERLRGWEWRHLEGRLGRLLSPIVATPPATFGTVLIRGTTLAATRGTDGRVYWVADGTADGTDTGPAGPARPLVEMGASSYLRVSESPRTLFAVVDGRLAGWDLAAAPAPGTSLPTQTIDQPFDARFPVLLAVSRDGRHLVACGAVVAPDDPVPVWIVDRVTGAAVGPLAPKGEKAVGAAFSPDGSGAVLGFEDGTVRLVDSATGSVSATARPHANAAFTFSYSPDARTIACGSDDRTLSLLDAASLVVRRRVRGFGDHVRGTAWSSDGRRIAGVDVAGFVLVAAAYADDPPAVLAAGDVGPLDEVEFRAGDEEVRVAGPRGVATFSAEGPETLHVVRAHAGVAEGNPTPYVYAVTADPTGRRFASGGWDSTVRVHDARTTALLVTIRCPAPVYATRFDSSGTRLAIACVGGTLLVASADGAILAKRDGLNRLHVQPLDWTPDGRRILALDAERRIVELDASTLATVHAFAPSGATPIGVAVSPDGQRIAILDEAGGLELRRREGLSGPMRAGRGSTTHAHDGKGSSVAWSADGRRLVTTGTDGFVRVADADGAEVFRLGGHEGTAYAAKFLGDDRIVSGGNDATIRVWDLAAGEEVVVLDGHEAYVFDLAVTPDGETVLSASGDDTVRIWSATSFVERRRRARPSGPLEKAR